MSRYNPASGGADEHFWGKHLPAEITPRAFAHVGRKFLRQKISVGIHEPFGLKLGTLGPDTPYAPRSCPVQKPIHFFSIAEVDGFQLQMSRCRHSVSFLNCTAFGDVRCTGKPVRLVAHATAEHWLSPASRMAGCTDTA